jgi:hypothetical protein
MEFQMANGEWEQETNLTFVRLNAGVSPLLLWSAAETEN